MSGFCIRPADESDAAAIASIYNHYVASSTATFDTVPKQVEDRVTWIRDHGEEYPVLVAESDGVVVGWGSLSRYAERPAWRGTVEVSVYIADTNRGAGVGPKLLTELIARGRELGYHALVSQVVSDNAPSIAMAVREGFEVVGIMREVGRKFDRWLDVTLLELIIDPRVTEDSA